MADPEGTGEGIRDAGSIDAEIAFLELTDDPAVGAGEFPSVLTAVHEIGHLAGVRAPAGKQRIDSNRETVSTQ